MSELPENVVRFDVLQVEYARSKMCRCCAPHYLVDFQNRIVYCNDCGAIVDPLVALTTIARDTRRWEDYTQQMLEQRRQIDSYKPRRVVIKELERKYVSANRHGLEPTCPHCGEPFLLKSLLSVQWCNPAFAKEAAHE